MSGPECHRKGCTRIRSEFSLLLSRRRPPRYDGYDFCSESCLETHLESELTERWHLLQQNTNRRIPRPRLGTILLQDSSVTPEQLDEAVNMQRRTHEGRIGEWLTRLGFVEEHQVTMALAKQYGLPMINLKGSFARSDAARLIPGKVARCTGCLPVGFGDRRRSLHVAVSGPVNFNSQEAIRRMVRMVILTFIGDQSAIESLTEQWYGPEDLEESSTPVYRSLDDLLELGRRLLVTAADMRADNVQAELLDDCFWARVDSGMRSRHLFHRYAAARLQEHRPLSERVHAALAGTG